MTTTIQQYQAMTSEWQAFQQAYYSAAASLNNVIAMGTTLSSDPTLAAAFPSTWPAYLAYLVTLKAAIITFQTSLPVAPPLGG